MQSEKIWPDWPHQHVVSSDHRSYYGTSPPSVDEYMFFSRCEDTSPAVPRPVDVTLSELASHGMLHPLVEYCITSYRYLSIGG